MRKISIIAALCLAIFVSAAPLRAPAPSSTVTGEFSIASVGDSILLRPIGVYEKDPRFASILKLLRDANVAFTNFELTVFDLRKFNPTPQAEYGGLWLHAPRLSAEELKWAGFDIVSRANNHTTDYGVEGMQETNEILDSVGLVHAGSGRNLGEARAPAYFQTAQGRVALIATASSHSPMARAAHARFDIKGRPGLSFLRSSRVFYLSPSDFADMKRVLDATGMPRPANAPPQDQFTFGGSTFKKGDKTRSELVADERDVKDIIEQVRSARRQADLVIVTIHAHEPGNNVETPADFLAGFAKAAIDAGADMFIGHGPHQIRGIEIYKDKPIFYSMGNFFFQYQTLEPQASDIYESFGLDPFRNTIADLYDATKGRGLEFKEDVWWESVVALTKFNKDKLVSIELHPVDLGVNLPRPQKGTPFRAEPAIAKKIIERMTRLSAPFGTKIRFENGVGIVDVKAGSTTFN